MNFRAFEGKPFNLHHLAIIGLVAILAACAAPVTPTPAPPAGQTDPTHAPVILRTVDRNEIIDGSQYIYQDIYFTDSDGDAVAVTYREISTSLSYPFPLSDDPIQVSVEEQKGEALFIFGGRCPQRMELVLESRIRDAAGNLSEPVTTRLSCTTPPAVDVMSILVSGLGIAAVVALFLALGFWLLFRKCPEERAPVLRSTLLWSCMILVANFVGLIPHEGGHALYILSQGVPATLYVHPFSFAGYARPLIDISIWMNIMGSVVALLVTPFISLPFWKRRSIALFPLITLFPLAAISNGLNILGAGGDFQNVFQYNGISPVPFIILGTLIFVIGDLLLFATLPILGLDPKDKKALFVLPAGVFLVNVLSLLVACFLVPGSPIDRQYFLAQEIVFSARLLSVMQTVIWFILAVLYITLYRWIHPKLPAWLRTETVNVIWKDLRLPAVLAVICVILGLLIIT